MRYAGVLLAIWLIIGAIAVAQRGYFTNSPQTCASAGTIALTVIGLFMIEGVERSAAVGL
ncbi:hypothetical protein [Mycobacteroides abscessus]|uniref:hypothetical protein n=1 Tax=Mycobacteroides abscessus TaxID=36809 RepID=UPI0005E77249|nr:hypothetical protein [Mycobacteroides abscessus]CPS35582.1 Uncharacterised protein [Mycobacteroides abscessus]CPV14170.1 Uncharacterised protein [Mycobacteroides abscessus]